MNNIEKFLQTLYDMTLSNDLSWKEYYKTSELYITYTCDVAEDTVVNIKISMDRYFNHESTDWIVIKNPNFVDKSIHISPIKSSKVHEIGSIIYKNIIKQNIPTNIKTDEEILEKIINNMPSKEIVRDTKIKTILT